jgi:ubiquinone/menaquinone biosynthesis C-methylase UbiE
VNPFAPDETTTETSAARRERYWLARFSSAAREAPDEAAVNIYSRHGWERRLAVFSGLLARLLAEGRVRSANRALDLGCGTGAYSRRLAAAGLRVISADYCHEMLLYARHCGGPVPLVRADGRCLPFPDGSFDLLVCIGVLQHVTESERFLAECRRVLRPSGVLVLMTLNRHTLLQALRRLVPAWRPDSLPADLETRRYGAGEVCRTLQALAPGCRITVHPVHVMPRLLRWCESLLQRLGSAGAPCLSLAVSFALVAELSAAAPCRRPATDPKARS